MRRVVWIAALLLVALALSIPVGGPMALSSLTTMGAGSIPTISAPGDCEWPTCFPSASTTGVPAGTTLTAYAGANPVVTNGAIIDSKTVTGCLDINASNVTIRKSVINCASGTAVQQEDDGTATGLVVQDTEIECTGSVGGNGITEGNFTATRVEIRSCENGISLNQGVTLVDSWIHDLEDNNHDPDMHEDGVQFSCGHYTGNPADTAACGGANFVRFDDGALNVTITHNRIEGLQETDGSNATSSIIMNKQGTGPDTNISLTENLFYGGGSTVYCTRTDSETGPGDIQTGVNVDVFNNSFSTVGQATTECSDEDDVSGNIVHETGNPYVLDSAL